MEQITIADAEAKPVQRERRRLPTSPEQAILKVETGPIDSLSKPLQFQYGPKRQCLQTEQDTLTENARLPDQAIKAAVVAEFENA